MTEEIDTALVERVACAFYMERGFTSESFDALPNKWHWIEAARAIIYPPAPPKTRLQVARELLADAYEWRDNHENNPSHGARRALEGLYDNNVEIRALLAALALPAMED